MPAAFSSDYRNSNTGLQLGQQHLFIHRAQRSASQDANRCNAVISDKLNPQKVRQAFEPDSGANPAPESPSGYRIRTKNDKKIRDKKITGPAIGNSIAACSDELRQKNRGQKNEKGLNHERHALSSEERARNKKRERAGVSHRWIRMHTDKDGELTTDNPPRHFSAPNFSALSSSVRDPQFQPPSSPRDAPSLRFSAPQPVQICAPRQDFHSPPPSSPRWRQ
jgi:hypothetical protein